MKDRVAAVDHAAPPLPRPLGVPQRMIVHADGGMGTVSPLARPQQVAAAELDPAPSDDARTVAVPSHEPCALDASAPVRFMQVDRSWLVVEEGDGLTVIDQHALHERVMFEDLRARIERSPLERQRLLGPELGGCGTGASCLNNIGSYTCSCGNGSWWNGTTCPAWANCPAGHFVQSEPSATPDRKLAPRPSGKFPQPTNAAACAA